MNIEFVKMHGAGNDMILIDEYLGQTVPDSEHIKIVRKMCARSLGIGSDGLIFVRKSDTQEADFTYLFYNPDGSRAEICVNGLRCFVKYVIDQGYHKSDSIKVATDIGIINGWVTEIIAGEVSRVKLQVNPPVLKAELIPVVRTMIHEPIDDYGYITAVGMGNPHAVLVVDDVKSIDVKSLGKAIRNRMDLFPKGTNVHFISPCENLWCVRSYERGVEDETLACGSGMLASAIALILESRISFGAEVHLLTTAGYNLVVSYTGDNVHSINKLFLEGPAEKVFDGCFYL
jgi:diaminopimelate epimerase